MPPKPKAFLPQCLGPSLVRLQVAHGCLSVFVRVLAQKPSSQRDCPRPPHLRYYLPLPHPSLCSHSLTLFHCPRVLCHCPVRTCCGHSLFTHLLTVLPCPQVSFFQKDLVFSTAPPVPRTGPDTTRCLTKLYWPSLALVPNPQHFSPTNSIHGENIDTSPQTSKPGDF